jgi:integration host factor subunit alpha
MIKKDIARNLYDRHGGITMQQSETYVNTLIDILKEASQKGDSITVTHFGKFRLKQKAVREIVLPTGKTQLTNAGTRLQFLPSSQLKTRVNAKAPVETTEV